jgi:hypothetical protein
MYPDETGRVRCKRWLMRISRVVGGKYCSDPQELSHETAIKFPATDMAL